MAALNIGPKVLARHYWLRGGRVGHAPGCDSKRTLAKMTGRELCNRYSGPNYNYYMVRREDEVLVCTACQGVISIK